MKNAPFVGLLDCNNFFVSCERLFRPDLRHRPVVVLSSNDGCVVARSQEIKDMGVPMGVPYFQIKDIVKDRAVVVFSSNFTLYRDISRRIFSIVKAECKDFEQYSIDEAFFHVDGAVAEDFARQIRGKIARAVGMPVSVGIASSKTLAKYASRVAKKQGGVAVLGEREWQALASTVRLGELWGVGSGRVRAFTAVGLVTAADLMRADPARVVALFGVEGTRLQHELLGEEAYAVGLSRGPQKSIMSSRSFKDSTISSAVVHDAVAYHVRRVVEDVRAIGMKPRIMTIFIGSSRFAREGRGRAMREIILDPPTDDVMELIKRAAAAVDTLYDPKVAYKKAGVQLGHFVPREHHQLTLFGGSTPTRRQAVISAIEKLNLTLGADMLRVGSRLQERCWQARHEALSPAYTTRWSDVAVAYAR